MNENNFEHTKNAIIEIIENVKNNLESVQGEEIVNFVQTFIKYHKEHEFDCTKRIFIHGVGRSGLVGKNFAIRLTHLDFDTYIIGDITTPAIQKNDLLITISGSGNTKSVVHVAKVAKEVGAIIISVTSNPDSEIAQLSNNVLKIKGRTKEMVEKEKDYLVRQVMGVQKPFNPLGTLFENAVQIFLDGLIVEIMKKLGKSEEFMKSRHANFE